MNLKINGLLRGYNEYYINSNNSRNTLHGGDCGSYGENLQRV